MESHVVATNRLRVALTQRRAVVATQLPRELVEDAELTVVGNDFMTFVADQLLIRLQATVFGEVIQREVVVHEVHGVPINWWQAWKELYAPDWYLRRWPVRRHSPRSFTIALTRWAHYPHAQLPMRPPRFGDPVIVDEYTMVDNTPRRQT